MTEAIKEKILSVLNKIHESEPTRGIHAHQEKLLQDYISRRRLENRHGTITDPNGIAVNLELELSTLIDASPYITPSRRPGTQYYVPKYSAPTKEERAKQISETRGVLKKLSEMHGIVPLDEAAYEMALFKLAENFLFEVKDGDVIFAKYNPSGIIAEPLEL
ncbi:MAG TPA: hypothetical protein VEB86_01645, partial [Chryseosolibacter sp.]|nr:hypothetical protein [Chryseosolibacter sp.]